MEDRYGLSRQHSGIWKSLRDGDFEEGDVWDVLKDTNNNNNRADYYYGPVGGGALKIKGKESLPIPAPRPLLPTASRMIPRPNSITNITARPSHESKVFQQSSAPVNIPDWSKIYNRKMNNNSQNKPHKNNNVSRFDSDYNLYHSLDHDDDDEYDPNKLLLPPHEFIARRLARSKISSFSVLEGVGRTLKGREGS